MFKVTAKTTPSGNYQTQATCLGPLRHTAYKKTGDKSAYKCPYCGHDLA